MIRSSLTSFGSLVMGAFVWEKRSNSRRLVSNNWVPVVDPLLEGVMRLPIVEFLLSS